MPPQIIPAARSRTSKACGAPERFVARLDAKTGAERGGAIRPEELLVHTHRDGNVLSNVVDFLGSRVVSLTHSEWMAEQAVRVCARFLPGLPGNGKDQAEAFRFRVPAAEAGESSVRLLREEARAALSRCGRPPRLRIFLTGATGFLGQELLAQAAADPHVEEVVCLVRTQSVRGRDGRSVRLGARARGTRLLERLGLQAQARRFRFVTGDVERPGLGLSTAERARLRRSITHVVHCAASVSFDAPYDESFRANVVGARNVLELSLGLQRARGSRFVAHVAIETSYVHGRVGHALAREGDLTFPPGYYNNYYELTKAMATLETDRAMRQRGLRVVQLLPSIVIGHSRTGNNRGDTKVVNAPINAFGRVKGELKTGGLVQQVAARIAAAAATAFPADGAAELNLVPVDRVAAGVLAALRTPEAVGRRIHLATDRRIRSEQMARVIREELEVGVRLSDPTLTRTLMLPVARAVLKGLGRAKLARSLDRLGTIFGVYSERGQPIHGVGDDVRVLGLPGRRPDTVQVFRMLCRHNRYVQEFGALKDADEIARRETVWAQAIDEIEFATGRRASLIPAPQFRRLIAERIDLTPFEPLEAPP